MGGARLKKHAYSFDEINNLRPCVLNRHVWWPFLGIYKIVMHYLIKPSYHKFSEGELFPLRRPLHASKISISQAPSRRSQGPLEARGDPMEVRGAYEDQRRPSGSQRKGQRGPMVVRGGTLEARGGPLEVRKAPEGQRGSYGGQRCP